MDSRTLKYSAQDKKELVDRIYELEAKILHYGTSRLKGQQQALYFDHFGITNKR